ncbi:eotaxin-like [Carassius carassius]|uniref:eotaxin-like n=1 Tax=Carassius carassius TaxID=217509 RepID=UPI0028689FED|nr:eotaxin-like [Carassius carassius]
MYLSSASQQMICLFSLVIFLCAFTSGVISHDPKRPTCCKEEMLTDKEPLIKITSCNILPATRKCLEAVVFVDKDNWLHCIDPKAPWLSKRRKRLQKNGVICKDYTKSEDTDMVTKHL